MLVLQPPLDVLPPLEVELLVELEVELLDELEELVEVEVDTLPEEVEVDDEVLTLPELVEVEVEILPEEVEVDEPPVLVLVEPPEVEVEPPDVEGEPPEVEVEPVLVEVMTTCPPELPPPPKNPPKNPPPKPPPQPPPITTGWPPPPAATGGSGASMGIAAMAIWGAGSQVVVRVTTRRMRLTCRGALAMRRVARTGALTCLGAATLACFTYCGLFVLGLSATCTAPPPISAPPAAKAASLAMAIRTDMVFSLSSTGAAGWPEADGPLPAAPCPTGSRNAERGVYDNRVNRFLGADSCDLRPV